MFHACTLYSRKPNKPLIDTAIRVRVTTGRLTFDPTRRFYSTGMQCLPRMVMRVGRAKQKYNAVSLLRWGDPGTVNCARSTHATRFFVHTVPYGTEL